MPHHSFTNPIGLPFIELQSVDSTNNYALEQVHAGLAQHGMAIFTHEQSAGKGQRGKTWEAEKHSNIILSLIINPFPLLIRDQFHLSICSSLAVYDFFNHYSGGNSSIKWPNDLYWQDRKAGGILIENVIGAAPDPGLSHWQWSVIGIGININQTHFPSTSPNAVSLKQITGRNFDPMELSRELCGSLDKRFRQLIEQGISHLLEEYNSYLYKRDENVRLKIGNRVFQAKILSVSAEGRLKVWTSLEEEFDFGEIEWIHNDHNQ